MIKKVRLLLALGALVVSAPSFGATAYQQAVLNDNPLLYWTFDEAGDTDPAASLVNDSAENTLNAVGSASRGPSTTTLGGASLGRAALINGTQGSMFAAPDLFGDPTPGGNNSSPGFDFIATQLWAVEFWFNVSDQANQYFSEAFDGAGGSNNPGLIYNFNATQVEMFTGPRTGVAGVTADEWHHVVFAFYGNSGGFADNLREIYVDGVLTQDTTSAFSAGHGLRNIAIGNAANGTVPINGMIDEYAIYELGNLPDLAARRAHVADIAAHYSLAPQGGGGGGEVVAGDALNGENLSAYNQAVLADSPEFYWTFDEATGAAIEQVNGLANDQLIPSGGATRVGSAVTPTGIGLGMAADIDGVNGSRFFASALSGTEIGAKWATEFWIQLDDSAKPTYIIESISGTANSPGIIHGFSGSVFELFQGNRTGAGGPTDLADGEWHHVILGNDTTTGMHTFIIDNGSPQTFGGAPGPVTTTFLLEQLALGATVVQGGVNVMDGRVDELAIYDLTGEADFGAALERLAGHYTAASQNTDVEDEMHEVGSSLYARAEFDVNDPGSIAHLRLDMRFDDGFVAYLNGTKVAEANAPALPVFDSVATGEVEGPFATQQFDLSLFVDLLEPAGNVLAIHGLNLAADDNDFLVLPVLTAFGEFELDTQETYFLNPTPGGPNGPGLGDPGPGISEVSVPEGALDDGQDTVVTARVDPTVGVIDGVELTYRVNYGASTTVPMLDDGVGADVVGGDGIYTAVIPEGISGPGDMVRYFVSASDTSGNDSRFPLFLDTTNSPEYLGSVVADSGVESNLPVLQWFLEPGTEGAAATRGGTRGAVFYGDRFYDNIFVRLRGVSINGTGKFSYKMDFNQHDHFVFDPNEEPVEEFDLNSTGLDKSYVRPILGFELMRDAGVPYSITFPMHVRRNGDFHSVALFVEDPNEEYLDRNGLDPEGALYKGDLNGFTTAAQPGYRDVNTGFKKETRRWEDNSDIVQFVAGLEQPFAERTNFIYDQVDLPSLVNYFAASALLQDADRLVNNFFTYRDPDTGLWTMLPWDLDLSQGQFQVGSDTLHADDDFPSGVSHPFHGIQTKHDFRNPSLWNNLLTILVATPDFRDMFLRRLRTLMDDFLKPEGTASENLYFENRIEELFAQMQDDVLLDEAVWGDRYGAAETFRQSLDRLIQGYYEPRRPHLYETHSIDNLLPQGDLTTIVSGEPGETALKYIVPTSDPLPAGWTGLGFDDSSWTSGFSGLGYENDAPSSFDPLISTRVKPQEVDPGATSILTRIPFTIDDLGAIEELTLRVRYDDGFVAYINGVQVESGNAGDNLTWNSTAAQNVQTDTAAITYANFDISAFIGVLNEGANNVLAIHSVNISTGSSDQLILAELVEGEVIGVGNGDAAGIPHEQVSNPAIEIDQVDFDANPVSGDQDQEYIRINNPTDDAVDISGWELEGGIEHTFIPGTVIPAGGSLYVTPDINAFRARLTGPIGGEGFFVQGDYDGHLSNFGEIVNLVDPDGQVADTLETPSLPSANQEHLRITELNFNPAEPSAAEVGAGFTNNNDFEFVELRNVSDTLALNLDGVRFVDGFSFDFSNATEKLLGPGEYVLVVKDKAAFEFRYPGLGLNVAGEFESGSLSNGGEPVKLDDADGSTIASFEYDDGRKWPIESDGFGASLEILDTEGDYSDADSWRASYEVHGTPGGEGLGVQTHVFLVPRDVPSVNETSVDVPLTDLPLVEGGEPDDFFVREGPGNEYMVEVWLRSSQLSGDAGGILGGGLTLEFDPLYATALGIDFGGAFDQGRDSAIDLVNGLASFSAGTAETTLGDDEYVLFARVLFASENSIDPIAQIFVAHDTGLDRAAVPYAFTVDGFGGVPTDFEEKTPDVETRAVIFDFDNNQVVNFADLGFFLAATGEPVGGSEPPYAVWADFDGDALVNGVDLDLIVASIGQSFDQIGIPENARTEGGIAGGAGEVSVDLLGEAEGVGA